MSVMPSKCRTLSLSPFLRKFHITIAKRHLKESLQLLALSHNPKHIIILRKCTACHVSLLKYSSDNLPYQPGWCKHYPEWPQRAGTSSDYTLQFHDRIIQKSSSQSSHPWVQGKNDLSVLIKPHK